MDMESQFWLHEFVELPRTRPHMEILFTSTPLQMAMNNNQCVYATYLYTLLLIQRYQYLLEVFTERIRWDPHNLGPTKPSPRSSEVGMHPHLIKNRFLCLLLAETKREATVDSSLPIFISQTLFRIPNMSLSLIDNDGKEVCSQASLNQHRTHSVVVCNHGNGRDAVFPRDPRRTDSY